MSSTIAAMDTRRSATRAREPDLVGLASHDGVRVAYESFGSGEHSILCLPSWSIVDQRQWKAQVPYLARHCRVVTFDQRGNGSSDHPADASGFSDRAAAGDALAVLDALGIERAAIVGHSLGARPALLLAAEVAERVAAVAFIGVNVPLVTPQRSKRDFDADLPEYEGWARFNQHHWRRDFPGFAEWFFGMMFSEPHSTRQIETGLEWSAGTNAETLIKTIGAPRLDEAETRALAARVRCPVLVLHGDGDRIRDHAEGAELAAITGGNLVTLEGSGHAPTLRDPVRVNLLLRDFLLPPAPPPVWRRASVRAQRALFVSSPIGLGHARRDLAIARELRRLRPRLQIDWLAQSPTTALLEAAGERVHPASAQLASECAHIESEAGGHRLPVFDALRRMDEILVANFMLFHDVASAESYDLWIGDEAWEVDHFLHENPELKSAPYAWLSDFVGYLPLPEGGEREALLTADYNAEMIEQVERFPRVRDRAIFVGDPEDVVTGSFGPDLPEIRPWVERHFAFSGHITGFEPSPPPERAALRRQLGWGPDEQICLVAVGGSGVGAQLLETVLAAEPAARRMVPGLRMVGVCGPRIEPSSIAAGDCELHGLVDDLHRWLEACDIGVVQGGLATTMELVAARRPFLFFPLEHHFEQQLHVAHRLARHGAGRRMEFSAAGPEEIAAAIAQELRRPLPASGLTSGAAACAADLIAPLLSERYAGGG
ncbi:MAG: hypothetical protein QOD37_1701 [Gaiellales bacterium]|nr:hypothetical protein [Gaiellales bacterium]